MIEKADWLKLLYSRCLNQTALEALQAYEGLLNQHRDLFSQFEKLQLQNAEFKSELERLQIQNAKHKSQLDTQFMENIKYQTTISTLQSKLNELQLEYKKLNDSAISLPSVEESKDQLNTPYIERSDLIAILKKLKKKSYSLFQPKDETISRLKMLSKQGSDLISMEQIKGCIKDNTLHPIFHDPGAYPHPGLLSQTGFLIQTIALQFRNSDAKKSFSGLTH